MLKERIGDIGRKIKKIEEILKIEEKKREISTLEKKISSPNFWKDSKRAKEIMQNLSRMKKSISEFDKLRKRYDDIGVLFNESGPEFLKEIEEEIKSLEENIRKTSFDLKLSGPYDSKNAIVILHSGAGGTEACDWCEMLLRLYRRWSERKGYPTEIIDIFPGEEAGIKSVTFIVRGNYAYGYLKGERGVHRLVRTSPFDSSKRRHTSFASCDVIPEVSDEIEIEIKEKDLRIDTFRASGHGGQHVNKTDSAVRITHIPTGIVASCQNERSQYKNKMTALKLLKARLFELEDEKRREKREKYHDEKGNIAWGNQIRSYVFMPYKMVKDLKTGYETPRVESVMDGDIDKFIEAYLFLDVKSPKVR